MLKPNSPNHLTIKNMNRPQVHSPASRLASSLLLTAALVVGLIFAPLALFAGTGGVPGGCAFVHTVNGKPAYEACTGANLPMWYSSSNPNYIQGSLPCGQYGNQNCGAEIGDPLSE